MKGQLSQTASLALNTLQATVLGAVLSLSAGVGLSAGLGSEPGSEDARPVDGFARQVHQAMKEHRCSTTGFGASTLVPTALIRTDAGRLRVVTFVEGWAVHSGERRGTLVAVCLDQVVPGSRGPEAAEAGEAARQNVPPAP